MHAYTEKVSIMSEVKLAFIVVIVFSLLQTLFCKILFIHTKCTIKPIQKNEKKVKSENGKISLFI